MSSQSSAGRVQRIAGSIVSLTLLAGVLALAPASALADTTGGQASAYLAYQQGINICTGWRPAFTQSLTRNQPPLSAQSTAVTVTGLTPGTSYTFIVNGIGPNNNVVPVAFNVV